MPVMAFAPSSLSCYWFRALSPSLPWRLTRFPRVVLVPPAACSALPHTANWHHPDVNILTAPEFSMVDGLACLPLEEMYFEDVYFKAEHFQWAITPDQNGFDV